MSRHAPLSETSRTLMGRLWRDYVRVQWPWLALSGVLMTIEGATLGVLSWMLKPTFDRIFVGGETGAIWWVGTAIMGLFVIRACLGIANRIILTRVAQLTSTRMQVDLLSHMMSLDSGYFQDNAPGALIEKVQGDTQAVQGIWQVMIQGLGRDIVSLVALGIVALSIDATWTLVAVVGIPLLILPSMTLQRYIRRKTTQMRAVAHERATRLDEIFHGINAIKLNGMEAYQLGRFQGLVDRIVTATIKTSGGSAMMPGLIDVVTGVGFFGVLVFGAQDIIDGDKTVGDFMSFFTAMALAFQPLRRIGGIAGTFQIAGASLANVYAIFDTPARITAPARPVAASVAPPRIELRDLHLSYGETPVLRGTSLTVEAGTTVALVGPSGAGKSTVFNTLTRLRDAETGEILIDGTRAYDMELSDLRGLFSVVTQDALLFDETIRDNILVGREDISEERLRAAVEAAHVSDFTDDMPLGLATPAGPRGSNLSGGQRQRVAIARAILRDTPILLLDEATSALDAKSEKLIQDALARLARGRTTLVIAHRLATIRDADRIAVMQEGRVVQEGTHDALLDAGGPYADLYRLQFSEGP